MNLIQKELNTWQSSRDERRAIDAAPVNTGSDPREFSLWIRDEWSNCVVENPNPAQNESIEFAGDCVSGIAFGIGSVRWIHNGSFHSREDTLFVGGASVGPMRVTLPDGRFEESFIFEASVHGVGGISLIARGGACPTPGGDREVAIGQVG